MEPDRAIGGHSLFFLIHAQSPVHMGTGASMGGIDLPHSREAASDLPNAPGSGVKGVLRDVLRKSFGPAGDKTHTRLFGSDWGSGSGNRDQGALMFSDAVLVCLPVASYAGGFAWITSPMCLRRMALEMSACGLPALGAIPEPAREDDCGCAEASPLLVSGKAYLHDIRLDAAPGLAPGTRAIGERLARMLYQADGEYADALRETFAKRLMVVDESVLSYLGHAAMDVRTRITMNDDVKTVRDGGLWVEESLPPESVLWGSIAADPIADREDARVHPPSESIQAFKDACGQGRRLQIGGKATVGRGVVRLQLHGGSA